jgi:hypothetical protein
MSEEIELHDSRVTIVVAGDSIVLRFCPAYVHHWHRSSAGWRGEGRSQAAEIVIVKSSVSPNLDETVFEVAGGWIEVGTRRHKNMIPVPLEEQGPVRGRLEFVNGKPLEVSGHGVTVRLVGEPEFVEDLPSEWAPE